MVEEDLVHFLAGWREEVRAELATNSKSHLSSKQKALAVNIADTFPSITVLYLYAQPVTSWSDGCVPPRADTWIVKLPDLPRLAAHCTEKFGWKTTDLVGRFERLIFSGMFIRRLTMCVRS